MAFLSYPYEEAPVNRPRTLSLKRETLSELSSAELDLVVGGSHLCTVTHESIDASCPTLPVLLCITPKCAT